MTRAGWTASIVTTVLLLAAASASAGRARFEESLRQAIATGAVDERKADLYRLYRLRDTDRLPMVLREAASAEPMAPALRSARTAAEVARPGRDGTGEMRLLRARLALAPAAVRAEAEPYLSPAAPRRVAMARVAGKVGGGALQNRVVTDNFSVEWGSALTNEDGSFPAADTGPSFAGDPAIGGNGVPDVVERWAAYLEASLGVVLGDLGFAPDDLATFLVPVYMGNSDPNSAIDDINSNQLFGFTEFPTGAQVPHLVMNNDFNALFNLTSLTDIQPLMKVTAAHEFFHVLHFLYEPAFVSDPTFSLWQEDIWWWEASATWMEDEVFDSVDDYHSWFQGAQGWTSLVETGLAPRFTDVNYAPRAYGASILAKYFSEHVGGRDSMRQVWDRIRAGGTTAGGMRVLDAFEDYAVSKGFTGLDELYVGFAGANAVMDYEEGDSYGDVPRRGSSLNATNVTLGLPAYLGATYRTQGVPTGSSGLVGDFNLSLQGSPVVPWGLAAVKEDASGEVLVLGGTDATGEPRLSLAGLVATDTVWAAIAFLDPDVGGGSGGTGSGGGGGGGCFVAELTRPVQRVAELVAQGYSLSLASAAVSDGTPPAAVPVLSGTAVPGGFDLTWTAPSDPDVAGYVVRWTPAVGAAGSRTLFGPIELARIGGLPIGGYDVAVFAYDEFGNADSAAATTVNVVVSQAAVDKPTPSVPLVLNP